MDSANPGEISWIIATCNEQIGRDDSKKKKKIKKIHNNSIFFLFPLESELSLRPMKWHIRNNPFSLEHFPIKSNFHTGNEVLYFRRLSWQSCNNGFGGKVNFRT